MVSGGPFNGDDCYPFEGRPSFFSEERHGDRVKALDTLSGAGGSAMTVRINWALGMVGERDVRRLFRTEIGDWCTVVSVRDQIWVAVLDYHPTIAMMRALRAAGADIADDVIAEGAEGTPIRWPARPAGR
jgi:hypothetical protein